MQTPQAPQGRGASGLGSRAQGSPTTWHSQTLYPWTHRTLEDSAVRHGCPLRAGPACRAPGRRSVQQDVERHKNIVRLHRQRAREKSSCPGGPAQGSVGVGEPVVWVCVRGWRGTVARELRPSARQGMGWRAAGSCLPTHSGCLGLGVDPACFCWPLSEAPGGPTQGTT